MLMVHPVSDESHRALDIFGPIVEFTTSPLEPGSAYCVMEGIIPPGVAVPLHSHPDPESFYILSGHGQTLCQRGEQLEWVDVKPGDFVHVPSGSKHAHRNTSTEPLVELIVTTVTLGRFFQEVGRPAEPNTSPVAPSENDVRHFQETAGQYNHWVASPEENAAVGIVLPA